MLMMLDANVDVDADALMLDAKCAKFPETVLLWCHYRCRSRMPYAFIHVF